VQTGVSDGRSVEITHGLTAQELVVQTFDNALQSGDKVEAMPMKDKPYVASSNRSSVREFAAPRHPRSRLTADGPLARESAGPARPHGHHIGS